RDLVARYEAAQSFSTQTGLFKPVTTEAAVEPDVIRSARALIRSRDLELDGITAKIRGEVLNNVKYEGKEISVADVLHSYRNQVLDAQDLHDFADSLLDQEALATRGAGSDRSGMSTMRGMWRRNGTTDNGSKITVAGVLDQVREKLAGAKDKDHVGHVLTQLEAQLKTDRAAGRSMDNRATLPLTDIAPVLKVEAGNAALGGRAADQPVAGFALGDDAAGS
ncbi:MAG: hypothetical protein ACOYKQ_13810, partial [Polymorphobacter sp.]